MGHISPLGAMVITIPLLSGPAYGKGIFLFFPLFHLYQADI